MPKKFDWECIDNGFKFTPKGKEITVNDIVDTLKGKKLYGIYIMPVRVQEDDYAGWNNYDSGKLVIDVYEFLDNCPVCGKDVFRWWCEKCGNEFHGHIEKDYKFCPNCGEKINKLP